MLETTEFNTQHINFSPSFRIVYNTLSSLRGILLHYIMTFRINGRRDDKHRLRFIFRSMIWR